MAVLGGEEIIILDSNSIDGDGKEVKLVPKQPRAEFAEQAETRKDKDKEQQPQRLPFLNEITSMRDTAQTGKSLLNVYYGTGVRSRGAGGALAPPSSERDHTSSNMFIIICLELTLIISR